MDEKLDFLLLLYRIFAEYGDDSGICRALAYEIAKQVGNFEGNYKGLRIYIYPEQVGDDNVPHIPQDARYKRGETYDSCRFGNSLVGRNNFHRVRLLC